MDGRWGVGVRWEAWGGGWMGGEGWRLDGRRGVGVGWEARGGGLKEG